MGSVSPCLSSCRQLPLFKGREKDREREENGKMLLHELGQILFPFWDVSALPAESAEVKAVRGMYFHFISKQLCVTLRVPLRCAVAMS